MNDTSDKWQPLESCEGLPGTVEDWLAEPGSLTARICARCADDFRLAVIDERDEPTGLLFADREPTEIFCREITLNCGYRSLVFARTRVPQPTLAAHPWLRELGGKPLGARLFAEPGYMRGRFHVARLVPGDELYEYVNARVVPLASPLWARRARVELSGHPFEICECFLPGLI